MDFSIIFGFFILISASQAKIVEEFKKFKALPGLVFFDLDFTLWPYWVDTTAFPPFHKNETTGKVIDARNNTINYYPDVPKVFELLVKSKIKICICAKTISIEGSKQLVEMFGWNEFIHILEINAITSDINFNEIRNKHEFVFSNVLYFDDEPHRHKRLRHFKVVSYPVEYGMTLDVLMAGLQRYSDVVTKKIKL